MILFLQLEIYHYQQDAITVVKEKAEDTIIWLSVREAINALKFRRIKLEWSTHPWSITHILKRNLIWFFVKFTGSTGISSSQLQTKSLIFATLFALTIMMEIKDNSSVLNLDYIQHLENSKIITLNAAKRKSTLFLHNFQEYKFVFWSMLLVQCQDLLISAKKQSSK